MVRIRAENGLYFHEPPYTPEEEEADFYQRTGNGPVAILRPAPQKPSAAPKSKSPQQPPEE
jgi:hypothetical protein